MIAATQDQGTLVSLAMAAMTCNACFENGSLMRSFVDLPQPRYVGSRYASASPRIAWVMINPGAGQADVRNQSWRETLIAFREGRASLPDVYAEQRRHVPYWNRLMPFIELHGLDTDALALINVAWCASDADRYPDDMLNRCWARHTGNWIAALNPNAVILSGRPAQKFDAVVRAAVPQAAIHHTFHYAYWNRPTGRGQAAARASELRQELGL